MRRRRQRGFSLIELMVGMLVSMICVLAIMAAFATYEGKKRTTTSGNDAQQNGSYALYALERQLRTAGSGIVQGYNYSLWGCPVSAYTNISGSVTQTLPASSLPAPFNSSSWPLTTRLVSVLVAAGGSNPDVIGVVGGNSAMQIFQVTVSSTPSVSSVVVANALGILSGDYLVGTLSNGTCALVHLPTAAPTAQVSSTTIALDAANSPPDGLVTATKVFDLGPSPAFTLFGVDPTTNTLVSYDLLQRPVNGNAATVTPIADGIVQIKALYGIHNLADSNPNQIDQWVQPTGTTWGIAALTANTAAAQTAMAQIQAIRVAVVAQSRLPERSTDYVGKTSLTLFPDLPLSEQYTVTTLTQYRYQVYDTTIPIRNALVTVHY